MRMKTNETISILLWLPQGDAAVVQGTKKAYVVFYRRYICTCPQHVKGHHRQRYRLTTSQPRTAPFDL